MSADGKAIQISVQCAPRANKVCILGVCSCSGGGTGHTFQLWVTAQKDIETTVSGVKGTIGPINGFDSTKNADPLKQLCDTTPISYTIHATGHYPDKTTQDFASQTELAHIPIYVARDDGFSVEWNPSDRRVSTTTPKNTCRGIY